MRMPVAPWFVPVAKPVAVVTGTLKCFNTDEELAAAGLVAKQGVVDDGEQYESDFESESDVGKECKSYPGKVTSRGQN